MEIIIKGQAGSGKSAVAQLVAETLRARGLTVNHDQPRGAARDESQLSVALGSIAVRTVVTVTEEQSSK